MKADQGHLEESDLHAAIMNIASEVNAYPTVRNNEEWKEGYEHGHRDARREAAELAAAFTSLQEERLSRMREALRSVLDEQDAQEGYASIATYDAARKALEE